MPGDEGAFNRILERMRRLSVEGAASVTMAISREALRQSQACFRESRNPYGEAWAPLKHRDGKPLLKTGRGRGALAIADLSPTGFRIGTNVRYMRAHQEGVDKTYARKPSSRLQFVGANGRFAKTKRVTSSGRARSLSFRRLTFNGGETHLVIPQRAFLPIPGRGLGLWQPAFARAGQLAIDRFLKG